MNVTASSRDAPLAAPLPLTTRPAVDFGGTTGLKAAMFRSIPTLVCLFGLAASLAPHAAALVGGAAPADEEIARHVVMIVGSRGTSCTATAIARDVLLTAAHCVMPG